MAAAVAEEELVVLLRCADLSRFAVPASLAVPRSGRVARAVDAGERVVDLPREVSGDGIAAVVAYWEGRAAAADRGADLGEFDGGFARVLTHDAAIDLINAAYHLGDENLFNLFL